jgi:anti-sigma factor RsiW
MTEQRLEELMVKMTDQVASAAEREELMAYLVDHPELRAELESHQALMAVTDGWVQRLDADLAEDRFARKTAPRIVQRLGLVLLVLGFLGLTGFSLVEAFQDPELPTWAAGALGLCLAGLVLFLGSAIHWRLSTHSHDPYKEVVR